MAMEIYDSIKTIDTQANNNKVWMGKDLPNEEEI